MDSQLTLPNELMFLWIPYNLINSNFSGFHEFINITECYDLLRNGVFSHQNKNQLDSRICLFIFSVVYFKVYDWI